ncbi:MAG: hypothetical protein WDW38_004869 [Sanguina aurantia]
MAPRVGSIAKKLIAHLPGGKLGLAVKIAIGLVLSAIWNSGEGKEEAMNFAADQAQEKRNEYQRYFQSGRSRKEFQRHTLKTKAGAHDSIEKRQQRQRPQQQQRQQQRQQQQLERRTTPHTRSHGGTRACSIAATQA